MPKVEQDRSAVVRVSARSVRLVSRIVGLAGSPSFISDIKTDLAAKGILAAVRAHDTPRLFDWLMTSFSYQGISDYVARHYIEKNGQATWAGISGGLTGQPPCCRLRSHWHFDDCRYDKLSRTCSEPELIDLCPLPRHRLRNGRLNQTAYSFYLFVRDIADSDLVTWIDRQIQDFGSEKTSLQTIATESEERLIAPLRHIYGLSDKILKMSLATLLIGASDDRPGWLSLGKSMIVVDSLVHNFFHRTDIMNECGANHAYGPGCYGPAGCAEVIRAIACEIDASTIYSELPADFPRFVQHAIWQYCAAEGLNICNGNRINDHYRCGQVSCAVYRICERHKLKP